MTVASSLLFLPPITGQGPAPELLNLAMTSLFIEPDLGYAAPPAGLASCIGGVLRNQLAGELSPMALSFWAEKSPRQQNRRRMP